MKLDKLERSLEIQPRHKCCGFANYLMPPTKGTDGFATFDSRSRFPSHIKIHPRTEWTFDIGNGGHAPPIKFCPFCGDKLP